MTAVADDDNNAVRIDSDDNKDERVVCGHMHPVIMRVMYSCMRLVIMRMVDGGRSYAYAPGDNEGGLPYGLWCCTIVCTCSNDEDVPSVTLENNDSNNAVAVGIDGDEGGVRFCMLYVVCSLEKNEDEEDDLLLV